eukprot:PhF_6_TR1959/c0_g1_i3/m.3187
MLGVWSKQESLVWRITQQNSTLQARERSLVSVTLVSITITVFSGTRTFTCNMAHSTQTIGKLYDTIRQTNKKVTPSLTMLEVMEQPLLESLLENQNTTTIKHPLTRALYPRRK